MDDFYKSILDNLYDGVYFVDRDRRITYWNKGAERITGFSPEQVIGSHCFDCLLQHVNTDGTVLCHQSCPLECTMREGRPSEVEVFLHHANGHRVPVLVKAAPLRGADGEILGAVEVFTDNSSMLATLKRVNELSRQATHDALTGVGNRRYAEAKIEACLVEYRQHGLTCGLILFDIDHFKHVNDTYGHDVGDSALKAVADTARCCVRTSDYVGRWGGEEFVVVLLNVNAAQLRMLAEKLRALIERSTTAHAGGTLTVTASLGATLTHPDDTPETLLRRADKLLYHSKTAGRNRVTTDAVWSS